LGKKNSPFKSNLKNLNLDKSSTLQKHKSGEYKSETRRTRIATLKKKGKEQQNHKNSRKVPKRTKNNSVEQDEQQD
jgi:hypothetical protein